MNACFEFVLFDPDMFEPKHYTLSCTKIKFLMYLPEFSIKIVTAYALKKSVTSPVFF